MGLFKNSKWLKNTKLFQKVTGYEEEPTQWGEYGTEKAQEDKTEDWGRVVYSRNVFDINDAEQRREYVQNCVDQITEASRELENLNFEYSMVTSYLKDMEEIEALPESERSELNASAQKIQELEDKQDVYLKKKNRMSDEKFHQMERMEEEAEEGCRKLAESEEYQGRIRQDMSRLEGEKHAYLYRKGELKGAIADSKGMAIIIAMALVVCLVILLALKYVLDMNTQLGFLVTTGIAAIAIIMLYMKYTEAVKELKRVEKGINRIILLQNRVKIRYVNNTNLLDYLYMKYQVASGKEFTSLWEKYKEEKEERRSYRAAELELDECQQEFLNILKCYQVKDPAIWLHQTAALLDNKEMVEIRHNLIIRRQSLRRRIDYNKEMIISKAQGEIKDLIESYPQYAQEIRRMTEV